MNLLPAESEKPSTVRRPWLAVAAVAVVVTGGLGVVSVYQPATSQPIDQVAKGAENLDPIAVLAASKSEISNARDLIVHAVSTQDGQARKEVRHTWYDNGNDFNWRVDVTGPGGELENRSTSVALKDGSKHQRIDFTARTVEVSTSIHPAGLAIDGTLTMEGPAYDFEGLDSSGVTYVGTETVDGRAALHFRDTSDDTFDFWIDSKTKLPIRVKQTADTFTEVTEYEWLDRTDERMADLTPPVPEGFRVVTSPESDPATANPTASTMPDSGKW